jgi:hypothetical protein
MKVVRQKSACIRLWFCINQLLTSFSEIWALCVLVSGQPEQVICRWMQTPAAASSNSNLLKTGAHVQHARQVFELLDEVGA